MALKMRRSISVHAGIWLMSEIVEPSGRRNGRIATSAQHSSERPRQPKYRHGPAL
jgi:hypothetical protein